MVHDEMTCQQIGRLYLEDAVLANVCSDGVETETLCKAVDWEDKQRQQLNHGEGDCQQFSVRLVAVPENTLIVSQKFRVRRNPDKGQWYPWGPRMQ